PLGGGWGGVGALSPIAGQSLVMKTHGHEGRCGLKRREVLREPAGLKLGFGAAAKRSESRSASPRPGPGSRMGVAGFIRERLLAAASSSPTSRRPARPGSPALPGLGKGPGERADPSPPPALGDKEEAVVPGERAATRSPITQHPAPNPRRRRARRSP